VFRHTHATLGEQIGMALSDRQAQMGHGDVRMTMHYTHSDIERRRAAVEAMANRLTAEAAGTVN
jgi:integrase